MPDLATWGILAAFLGGLVSFFSPCTLPLVPGYLSVVTGGAVTEASNRLKALWLSVCFVLGFSLVFVALGASASLLGQWLMAYRQEANLVAGLLIVLMGLFMLGWWSMPALQRDWRLGHTLEGGRPTAAFVLGVAFAIGWTPCIGPILGAILALSSTHANAETGMLYLAVYSLGLALPFLGTALFIEHFRERMRGFSRWSRPLRAVAGLVLVIMGVMVITGQMTRFASWMLSTFPVLGSLG
ncbi:MULTISPECIES: cytochrome c biogenesis CcdA family protein [Marinobacter]|uniref:Cytochrome c-type biogenesis protein n=2 Tax=Marinobacter TaxID=2742 RepID=A0A366G4U9_9GAMM|nr:MULTISPECIES: cytochrome c biogenesis protein CcdA [Marinobacter]MBD3657156.1 cytochrome c biogenesis protein CcdA [Marinobacter sp.]PHQ15807.1 cytochrome C biogenesis protein [Marinobacter profundi]RBP21932.1 cytochrome c-type biogenesis protein [Marinobacter pelagius]